MPYAIALRRGGACTISEYWKNIPELPDVSSRLVERRPPPATLHGVVFDILAARPCDGPLAGRGGAASLAATTSARASARAADGRTIPSPRWGRAGRCPRTARNECPG